MFFFVFFALAFFSLITNFSNLYNKFAMVDSNFFTHFHFMVLTFSI